MKREKQTTINSATQPSRVEVEVKALVDLIRLPFQIFLKISLVILVEAVPLEDQAIEVMT